jgi:hypothetical protein
MKPLSMLGVCKSAARESAESLQRVICDAEIGKERSKREVVRLVWHLLFGTTAKITGC